MTTVSRRTQLIGAAASVGIGLLVDVMIYFHPEGLRVPAWVAYVAASAFVFAGLCLLAGAFAILSLQRWLGIAVAVSLFVVIVWIAFGPGVRACSISLPFGQGIAPDVVCRGAFGIGAVLIGLFLVLALRRFIGTRSAA
jgi:hypothetical protein